MLTVKLRLIASYAVTAVALAVVTVALADGGASSAVPLLSFLARRRRPARLTGVRPASA
ncbi:MAG: hypothetical protein ACXVY6_02240 [Gaiellaceae bacterium]